MAEREGWRKEEGFRKKDEKGQTQNLVEKGK
jgi:hypothetical protein